MKNLAQIAIFIGLLQFLFSCNKQEVGPQCPTCTSEVETQTKTILIGCEGNFGWGNASISQYNPAEKTVQQNIYQTVNNTTLGDVLQSFSTFGDQLFVTMNNSGKVLILDSADYSFQGEITGLTSPRYMLHLNSSKAYITDLYNNAISIVNPTTNTTTGTINTNHWTEKIYEFDNKIYACVMDTNWVFVINPNTDIIEDTLFLSKSPTDIVRDAQNRLWILCTGGFSQENAKLYTYNTTSKLITQTLTFAYLTDSPSNLRIKNGTELYYLNNGLHTLTTTAASLPTSAVINNGTAQFYSLNIDPNNADIYITDAIDYVQPGLVYRFDSLFNPLDTFQTGIIPQAIRFE